MRKGADLCDAYDDSDDLDDDDDYWRTPLVWCDREQILVMLMTAVTCICGLRWCLQLIGRLILFHILFGVDDCDTDCYGKIGVWVMKCCYMRKGPSNFPPHIANNLSSARAKTGMEQGSVLLSVHLFQSYLLIIAIETHLVFTILQFDRIFVAPAKQSAT